MISQITLVYVVSFFLAKQLVKTISHQFEKYKSNKNLKDSRSIEEIQTDSSEAYKNKEQLRIQREQIKNNQDRIQKQSNNPEKKLSTWQKIWQFFSNMGLENKGDNSKIQLPVGKTLTLGGVALVSSLLVLDRYAFQQRLSIMNDRNTLMAERTGLTERQLHVIQNEVELELGKQAFQQEKQNAQLETHNERFNIQNERFTVQNERLNVQSERMNLQDSRIQNLEHPGNRFLPKFLI